MSNKIYKLDMKLLNTRLRFSTEKRDLNDIVVFFTGLTTESPEKNQPHIFINLTNSNNVQKKNYNKISRNIWIGDYSIFISKIERLPGLSINAQLKNDKLYINAVFEDITINLLKKILSFKRNYQQQKQFLLIGLIYYLIYFPYLYYLERFNNLSLLHAGAVKYKQNGIILSGLGGIGKSTFAFGTLLLDECKFLSDNLIFYDKKNIYPFPEPIALNPKSLNMLNNIDKILIKKDIASTHGRMFYQINPNFFSDQAIPQYLFWLQWGNENKLISFDKERCVKNLLDINLLANELREYYIFAATLDLAFSKSLPPDLYYKNLSKLLSNVDCYILEFKPNIDITTVFDETVARIIS